MTMIDITASAHLDAESVATQLRGTTAGLTNAEAAARLRADGPNTLPAHRSSAASVLGGQLKNPILLLLAVAGVLSLLTGSRADAIIILIILSVSVGIGFWNEYRAQRTADSLQAGISHTTVVVREGNPREIPVHDLVTGDLVRIALGNVVPADIRLLQTTNLSCDEAAITGESVAADKDPKTLTGLATTALGDLTCCALMGTVVASGNGSGLVVATGQRAAFGAIAASLATAPVQTSFQVGLAKFSRFLMYVAIALTVFIFAANLIQQRPLMTGLMFALAIAVGITPQLLPAIVTTSLAAGAKLLAKQKVLVKRLVCIEDLGNVDVLVTDKTGTLTDGQISYLKAVPASGHDLDEVERLGLLACSADFTLPGTSNVGQDALDTALATAILGRVDLQGAKRVSLSPFDHDSRTSSVVVAWPDGSQHEIVKGAPESMLATSHPTAADQAALAALFADGVRVISVAFDGQLVGHLSFLDQPKDDAAASLARLAELNVAVKVATGDNAIVAEKVCRDLGLDPGQTLTGDRMDALSDIELQAALQETAVLARVSPQQKARIVEVLRAHHTVAFMGDGVNDAPALHAADVGISVDMAVDVAKQAADVVLLDKDLGVVADAVTDGRRVFTNTIKYVQMGTSSNFGNMFSAALASLVLPFLPMTPGQILLNNLLYDTSQLAIPVDHVDDEQLRKPSHWDISQIRKFMLIFGPISSVFDFATFFIMLKVLHAGVPEFQAGWFVESLATQTLIVFAIRTRRSPMWRSQPGKLLAITVFSVIAIGVAIPYSPAARLLGFNPLPLSFLFTLLGIVIVYLVLVELAKIFYYRQVDATSVRQTVAAAQPASEYPATRRARRMARRASRLTAHPIRPER